MTVRTTYDREVIGSSVISDDGFYRYELRRTWADEPPMTFVMLNPSTADASKDDPTIRRCVGFAKREGCGGIVVVNLFALRVTRPVHLFDGTIPADPCGEYNLSFVKRALDAAEACDGPVVVAWGAHKDVGRSEVYQDLLNWEFPYINPLLCLGTTQDNWPRHPLYVRADQPLEVWA